MRLIKPQPRLCPNKTVRYPITGINPLAWIKGSNDNYTVTGIDGFIVTDKNLVNGLFLKYEYIRDAEDELLEIQHIAEILSVDELICLLDIATVLKSKLYTFIWPQDFPSDGNIQEAVIYSYHLQVVQNAIHENHHRMLDLGSLEHGIRALRGRSFDYPKSLLTASSFVECYLANNTKNPWPGDIDAVIYDKASRKCLAVIEFKTHNMDRPIKNEYFGKYDEDWRRFAVLFDLADNFQANQGSRPKLLNIIWGTNPDTKNHEELKIDEIERKGIVNTFYLARPQYNVFSQELFEAIIARCI